jgi:hypothetical protein
LAQIILGRELVQKKLEIILPRGDNSKRVKKYFKNLKISSRTRPVLIKFGTNQPWVKRIQVCSNKGSQEPLSQKISN